MTLPVPVPISVTFKGKVTTSGVTVSCVVPKIFPLVAVIVMGPPAATPVAKPLALMVAMPVDDEDQITELVRFCVLLLLNVPVAVNCTVLVAITEGFVGVTAIDTRLIPVPLRGALCVDAATPFVLLIVTKAVRGPFVVGSDETCRLHEAPAPSVAGEFGQPLTTWKSPMFGPDKKMLVSVTGVAPGFFTLIVCDALCVPSTCAPNTRFGGVNVSVVAPEAAGGLAITIPNGAVVGMEALTVLVDV